MYTGPNAKKARKLSKLVTADKWLNRYSHLANEYEKALMKIKELPMTNLTEAPNIAIEVLDRISEEVQLWK